MYSYHIYPVSPRFLTEYLRHETHHVSSRNARQNYQSEQHSVAQQYQVPSH
jgi:hypothetical protein